jgi:hypothetical protein
MVAVGAPAALEFFARSDAIARAPARLPYPIFSGLQLAWPRHMPALGLPLHSRFSLLDLAAGVSSDGALMKRTLEGGRGVAAVAGEPGVTAAGFAGCAKAGEPARQISARASTGRSREAGLARSGVMESS